ncbi:hypothetical protein K438DRAFT_2030577 [Mycena galopus ATCC 62051]|nr:hypothetical protein K438DRAFT_2030577 [Mycena galopus ATCC 62051]
MRLGDLHVCISVDGVELSEFAVEYSVDGKEATCWISSECDKKFSVKWKNTNSTPGHIVNAQVTVDGIRCGSNDLVHRDRKRPHIASGSRDSVATSAYTRRPLMFARQALTDDDNLLNATISPELGSVKVELRNVRTTPSRHSRRPVWRGSSSSFEAQVLHEQSKKAIGHSVQFGAEFAAYNRQTSTIEVLRELATFVFKYRPIELLRAQGIVPPVVRPQPAASSTEVVDLTMDDDESAEIAILEASRCIEASAFVDTIHKQARLRVLKKNAVQVKSEPSGVKREKDFVFKPGEVIDLT